MSLMAVSCTGNIIATSTTKLTLRFFAMFLMRSGGDILPDHCSVYGEQFCAPAREGSPRLISELLSALKMREYEYRIFWLTHVQRSACIAICNMITICATTYRSYMYPASTGPQYAPGGSANAAVCFLVICWAMTIRLCHKRENEMLEQMEMEGITCKDANARGRGF